MAGRPTKYTEKLGTVICRRIAKGESVRKICKGKGMPNADTIYTWLLDPNKKIFSEQYAKARNAQAESMFEELLDIADTPSADFVKVVGKNGVVKWVQNGEAMARSRLRVDTRKWYLSKVLPKKFGDKLDMTSGGEPINPSSPNPEQQAVANKLVDDFLNKQSETPQSE